MGSFRDDREAMRARIEALEAELKHGGPDREEVLAKLADLAGEVSAATSRVDADRKQLADVASRIDALREDLGGKKRKPAVAESEPEQAAPKPTKAGPIIAVGILVLACIIGIAFISHQESGTSAAPMDFTDTVVPPASVPGGIHAAEPMTLLQQARSQAPPASHLVSVRLAYVKSDGTIDLQHTAYSGSMTFEFSEPPSRQAPDPATPVGAPEPVAEGGSTTVYRVDSGGMHSDPMFMFLPSFKRPVPMPTCTPAEVWRAAIDAGAPRDAVASLDYTARILATDPSASQGSWHFTISGTSTDLRISDPGCQLFDSFAPAVQPSDGEEPASDTDEPASDTDEPSSDPEPAPEGTTPPG